MKRAVIIGILLLFVGIVCIRTYSLPAISDKVQEAKKVALTFDDGPHQKYTKMLLDGLKERNVIATFFLIGESIEGKEELVKRMSEEGHLIGNHTYYHTQLTKVSTEEACTEIWKTNTIIYVKILL